MNEKYMRAYKAWAINTNSPEMHGLIGRYWWNGVKPVIIPMSMEGYKSVCFETRKKATSFLKSSVRKTFPKAKVVRVKITVEEV